MPHCPLPALLLCFLTLSTGGEEVEEQEVRVYSLQRGVWTIPSTSVYLRYNFPVDLNPVTHLTVCYRIRLEKFADYNIHLSYATSEKDANSLLLYNMATQMLAYVNNLQQTLVTTEPLEIYPETWNHFCHVLEPGAYTLYWQGKASASPRVHQGLSIVLHGDITQLNFWDRVLSAAEVEDLAACRINGRGNVFSLDTADVKMMGDVLLDIVRHNELCRSLPHYMLLPERRSVSASLVQCHLFNASMSVPGSIQDNDYLKQVLLPFMDNCSSTPWKLWLGVTDQAEEGVWVDMNVKKFVEFQNFVSPFPYGGSVENCAALFPDGTWGDAKCSIKKCSSCEFKPSEFLRLRGLCFEEEQQTRFRVADYVNGRPLLRGFYDLLIMWDNENAQWLLRNTANTTLASLSPSDLEEYPLGQKIWLVRDLLCGSHAGTSLNLSVSPCLGHHFMCRSGECIAHQHRCNMRYECSDGSDEDDCDIVNLPSGYRRHLTPPGTDSSSLIITPNITINRIMAVDERDMTVTIEFQVKLTWLDERLSFSHLESTNKGTVLSREDVKKIWTPLYRLSNLKGGHLQLLEETVRITTARHPKHPDFNNVKMDLVYPGGDNELIITQDYIASFTCPFEFYTYPFDIHVCTLNLCLPSTYENFVELSEEMRDVTFTGPQELTMFSVLNVHYGPDSGKYHLSVEFELHCHGSAIVLSLFIPSLFLLAISWSSLFVKWEAFSSRLMVSVSALLVFYTLRFTLIGSMPMTLAIKLIDIWFFFIISVLSVNIIIHIFIQEEFPNDEAFKKKPLFVRPAGGAVILTPESIQPSHPKFITIYRRIILPGLIVTFNIIFWLTLLLLR
ncbi:Gamma-aminobutyric acid receptor subunit beta-like 7 [Homarus americanus]|uniref:Gamma-aminobutyric acid receptor subunit beta-like 7 n=1 Tax=Homarus americanus TaxID=6706 RepID=A0A8J5JDV7_HOMAM|nr:Gamma-aminobutyric acid receptor subunit beta-like 7 [Homarus americanus]